MKLNRFLIFTVIGIASVVLAVVLYAEKIDFFNSIDLKLKDVRFRTRGDIEPDRRVVIVAIDEKSINELGRWPWDRRVIAQLIENLKRAGARTIALDIIFSEPSKPVSDSLLGKVLRRSDNVILGYFFRSEGEPPSKESLMLLEDARIKIVKTSGNVTEVPVHSYPSVELNIPIIAESARGVGFFNIIPDRDGILRSANALILYDGYLYPSLAISALRHYLKQEIVIEIADYGVTDFFIGEYRIPCDESGRLTINYYGSQGVFRTIPAVDVIKGGIKEGELRDSIVLVGATETGIADVRATPVDPVLPGIEVHATVVSNALQKRFLIRDWRVIGLDILFIMVFTLMLTTSLSLVRKTLSALLFFLTTLGLYYTSNYFIFKFYPFNTSVLFPLISLTLSYLGSEAYRNFIEERQGRFLKKAFSSYVSPELVSEIIKNPHLLKLGGEKRLVTILFSDIRDFTTISEKLTPEALVSLLNRYLSPMTEIVLKYRGTLDKYIGDAIMAIYNAPLTVKDHPVAAVKTSIEMLDKLREINRLLKKEGLPEIDIGIGINTGECVIGNIGTQVRFDYTAIGDAVNLASRLEGLNKIYKTHTIMSEYTLKEIEAGGYLKVEPYHLNLENGKRVYLRELDYIRVKGKKMPVRIFEIMVDGDPQMVMEFLRGLELYRKRRFTEAIDIFRDLPDDGPSMVYISRCEYFIEHSPEDGWDGVFTLKEK